MPKLATSWLHGPTKDMVKTGIDFGKLVASLLQNRRCMHAKRHFEFASCKMTAAETKAYQRLQQHCTKLQNYSTLTGWTVQTGKQGLHNLHTTSGLRFHALGTAAVAVHAFCQFASAPAAESDSDDDADEKEEIISIATGLDGIVCQLHKQMATLQTYRRVAEDDAAEVSLPLQPKIENMYDACPYVHVNRDSLNLTQQDTLLQRSTKLRCQLLLATCAVFIQKLLHRSSYTSGYRQHCMYTLLQELRRTGPDNPALSMLVEPLLPRPWRKELDRQKLLMGDEDTDLYSAAIAQEDVQHAPTEEGEDVEDGWVVADTPSLIKLTGRMHIILEALDLVPVCKRQQVKQAVADAVEKGLDAMLLCWQQLDSKYSQHKHHQTWLHALKQALSTDQQDQVVVASKQKRRGSSS